MTKGGDTVFPYNKGLLLKERIHSLWEVTILKRDAIEEITAHFNCPPLLCVNSLVFWLRSCIAAVPVCYKSRKICQVVAGIFLSLCVQSVLPSGFIQYTWDGLLYILRGHRL